MTNEQLGALAQQMYYDPPQPTGVMGGVYGAASDADQAAMLPETFNPIPDWTRQAAQKDVGTLRDVGSLVGSAASGLSTLPQRAIEASAQDVQHLGEADYQPQAIGPALEAAGLPMGTGAIAGVPVRAGEAVLGAGAIRKLPTPDDIAAIKAAAVGYGRKGWPSAEREVFSTAPEAYAQTPQLVPQQSVKAQLPGPLPGEALPLKGRADVIAANADPIAARIAERLQPMVAQDSPLLKFYHTAPVVRGLQDYGGLSLPEANTFMRDWAGQGAATSPRTQTPPNLRNSSYLMYQRAAGNPLTPERYAAEGNVPGFPMMGMHVDLADKFARGAENPWTNPKPYTFRENWAGNLSDVTGDTHNIRSTLYEMDQAQPGSLPRGWFSSDAAFDKYRAQGFRALEPGEISDTLGSTAVKGVRRQSEYLPMTEPWYRAAGQLGIHPAEAQSGGWFFYGPITGLQSPPKTITNLLNDQVNATAKVLNVPPEQVVNWWANRKIPLAGVAGAMGSLAAQDNYQPQE
jgi:hypothetical protein